MYSTSKHYQEKWQHHVQRMDTNRLPKQALQYKPKGWRNIRRPRKRWRDQLHLEDQGTGNMPNSSGTWWWWWWNYYYYYYYYYYYRHLFIQAKPIPLPHGLRRVSSAARLLGLRVRILQLGHWIFSVVSVLSGRDLCVGVITGPEDFHVLWGVRSVWSWSPVKLGHRPDWCRNATEENANKPERIQRMFAPVYFIFFTVSHIIITIFIYWYFNLHVLL